MAACEIPHKGRAVVVKRSVCLAVAAVALCAHAAFAVDIENHDRQARDVTINRSDGSSETLTVKAGQRLENICTDCVILSGNSSVETRGRATVKIEGGEVSITAQR